MDNQKPKKKPDTLFGIPVVAVPGMPADTWALVSDDQIAIAKPTGVTFVGFIRCDFCGIDFPDQAPGICPNCGAASC